MLSIQINEDARSITYLNKTREFMSYKIFLFYFSVLLLAMTSCSKGKDCQDVNLGIVSILDEGPNHLNLADIDSLIYLDQDSNLISIPFVGSRIDNYFKTIQYKCTDDGNFYTADYQIELRRTSFQIEFNEFFFAIEEKAEIPLKSSVESKGLNARSIITNKFTNEISILIYDNSGSNTKLRLFSKTNDDELNLDDLNQFHNEGLKFHDVIEFNGKEYFNVYSIKQNDTDDSEVFYSEENGLIRFTDKMNNTLTLDKIIFY